jgi:hypothetical protein
MEMPEETKLTLQTLERRVHEIHYMYMEEAKKQAKPYIDMIMDIRAMYPTPIIFTEEMLESMGINSTKLTEMIKEQK